MPNLLDIWHFIYRPLTCVISSHCLTGQVLHFILYRTETQRLYYKFDKIRTVSNSIKLKIVIAFDCWIFCCEIFG